MKTFPFLKGYRQHTYALIGVGALLFMAVYSISIKRTLALRKNYVAAQQKINLANSAGQQINDYNRRLAKLHASGLQPYNRPYLLEKMTSFCKTKGILIRSFPKASERREDNYTIVTDEIEVEGAYKDIVELVYLLEQEERLGSVSSMRFFKHKDRERRRDVLRCKIVLRNLIV